MKRYFLGFLAGAMFLMAGSMATAQEVASIGTNPQGSSLYNLAKSMAKGTEKLGLELKLVPFRGSAAILQLVASGKVDFGMATRAEIDAAREKGIANIKILRPILEVRHAYIVRVDSGIYTFKDLKGRRLPTGFVASLGMRLVYDALLANAGLGAKTTRGIPITGLKQSAHAFALGRVDAVSFFDGSGFSRGIAKKFKGARRVSVDVSPSAVERMRQALPGARVVSKNGVAWMAIDILLYTRKDVSTSKISKVLAAHKEMQLSMVED